MENTINAMEQNAQQVGQTPESQSSSIPSQPPIIDHKKKNIVIILCIVGAFIFMFAGAFGLWLYQNKTTKTENNLNTAVNSSVPNQSPTISISPKELIKFQTITKPNQQDKSKTDIYVKNLQTGEEIFFITLSDVYTQHFHNSEYHNGNLYVIKRTGNDTYPSEAWMDELWKYDSSKNGQKLFSLKGLTFLVSPNESLIAITEGTNKLTFIDSSGTNIKEYTLNQLSNVQSDPREPRIGIDSWSSDSKNLWGDLGLGPVAESFYQINSEGWNVIKHDVSSLAFGSEVALNPDLGKIAYTNYPVLLDVDTANQFKVSKKKVTLYIYDFNTKTSKVVSSSIVKSFNPKWVDTYKLEYNDPNSEGRLTYSVQ